MAVAQKRTTGRGRGKAPKTLKSFNPRTGEVMQRIPTTPVDDVANLVDQARKVAPEWAAIPAKGRVRILSEVRHLLFERMDEIADVVAAECGKPKVEALTHDVMPSIVLLHGFERLTPSGLEPMKIGPASPPVLAKMLSTTRSRIEWRPFGVVGAITPWNYPLLNCFLAFAPALFAGNTVVIKPSETTPGCGEIVRQLLEPLPPGVATVIQGAAEVGAALVDAPCDKISFIGSPVTGRKICQAAAKHLTPVVMELGGVDAAIVCEDADLELTSSGILWGSFFNAGQTCCSIERVYVVDSVADAFLDRLTTKLQRIRQGDDVGTLTSPQQLEVVRRHISEAVEKGARIVAGGPDAGIQNENGTLWHAPTILTDLNDEMEALTAETFGPLVSIVRVQDEQEAVTRANRDAPNLTASVWTKNKRRAARLGRELKAGTISVNQHGETAASPWATWGGVGESGFGRLNGLLGLREFSVPVHVADSSVPLKRLWWFPYDDASETVVRSTAQAFGARTLAQRLRGLGNLLRNSTKALKAKL